MRRTVEGEAGMKGDEGGTRGDRTLGLGRNSRRKMDMGFKLMNSGGGYWAEAETQERGNHGIL